MQDSLLQDKRDAESVTSMPRVAHLNHSGMYWNVEPAAHSSISHTTGRLQPTSKASNNSVSIMQQKCHRGTKILKNTVLMHGLSWCYNDIQASSNNLGNIGSLKFNP